MAGTLSAAGAYTLKPKALEFFFWQVAEMDALRSRQGESAHLITVLREEIQMHREQVRAHVCTCSLSAVSLWRSAAEPALARLVTFALASGKILASNRLRESSGNDETVLIGCPCEGCGGKRGGKRAHP